MIYSERIQFPGMDQAWIKPVPKVHFISFLYNFISSAKCHWNGSQGYNLSFPWENRNKIKAKESVKQLHAQAINSYS